MAMTEAGRHELYEALKEAIGMNPATTLMEAIPPVGWADIATKRDLDNQLALIRADFDALRAEVGGIHAEHGGIRAEVAGGLDQLRAELYKSQMSLQRTLLLGMLAAQTAFAAVLLAAFRAITS